MRLKTRLLKVIVLLLVFALGLGTVASYAAGNDTKDLRLEYFRYIKGNSVDGYALNTGSRHPVYQILSSSSTAETNYYCLNATKGYTWTHTSISNGDNDVTYTKWYDLNSADDINLLKNDTNTVYSDIANSEYLPQILWILDNMFIPDNTTSSNEEEQKTIDDNNLKQKQELLSKAGIKYKKIMESLDGFNDVESEKEVYIYEYQPGYDYRSIATQGVKGYRYFDENDVQYDVVIDDELVEVVQQAAIWYYTNYKPSNNEEFNVYNSTNWLFWSREADAENKTKPGQWELLKKYPSGVEDENDKIGGWYQEQATILFNYLVDAAQNYKESLEEGDTLTGNPLTIAPATTTIQNKTISGTDYYVVGPMTISQKREAVYSIENTISVNGSTNTNAYLSDNNGTRLEDQKVSNHVGTEFYVTVPKSKVTGNNITISFDGKYKQNGKKLWTVPAAQGNEEQPVVEVTPGEEDLKLIVTAPINKEFDLALRKQIIGLKDSKGHEKFVINENGLSAERNMSIDTSSISGPDTTATYKHRKDPVVVEKGDVVTYKISVYNEGEMAGYAEKIVDKLPEGLTLNGSSTGTTKDGSYSYVYDAETNSIVFTNQSKNVLTPFDGGNTLSTESIEIECKVDRAPTTVKTYLTNIAYISKSYNTETEEVVVTDRDSSTNNNPSADQVTTGVEYTGYHGGNNHNQDNNKDVYRDGTNNDDYFPGREDDDDFEVIVIKPAEFDLALQKYISKVTSNGNDKAGRQGPSIDTTLLASKERTTATYTQDKTPIKVKQGDFVTYTFTVYNEGEIDGYVTRITDNIPTGLEFVYQKDNDGKTLITCDSKGNSSEIEVDSDTYQLVAVNSNWSIDSIPGMQQSTLLMDTYNGEETTSISCDVESYLDEQKLLAAYDSSKDINNNGAGLDRLSVTVVLRVVAENAKGTIIRNEAAITGATDKDGNVQDDPNSPLKDRDSQVTIWKGKDGDKDYQDDEDFDNIILGKVDLALTKFIVAISDDMKFEDGEFLTEDTTSKNAGKESNPYTRQTAVDTTKLKNGTSTTADYIQVKTPLTIPEQSYVLYNIRVYNEGEVDVYAGEVADYLPNYLDYVSCEFNDNFGWNVENDGKTVKTSYLSHTNGTDKILKAFDKENDDGKGSKLDYKDLQILCRVNNKAPEETKLINTAEITKYEDEDGEEFPEDIDSKPDNVPEKNVEDRVEDDDDYEVVLIRKKKVDIALSKFIAAISSDTTIEDGEYVTADGKVGSKENPYLRATKVDTTPLKNGEHDAIYTKDKTPIVVPAQSYVLYDIRVYNEGEVDLYAGEVTDYLPANLDYVSCEFNDKFGWTVGEDGKTIKTTYLSFEKGEQNLLNAFDKVRDDGAGSHLDYRDLQILCRVSKDAPSNTNIVNVAEITKYEDEGGEPIPEDIDSKPDNVNENHEDDDDYEVVLIKTFDLALLKWVSTVYVTENGVTKTTQTGNTGDDNTDIIPKVEINRKKINSTVVKFGYTIKITNEGDIAGAATEITDYVPQGLKFYKEDNNGWVEKEDGVITTRLLENTILQPGESAEVTVIFRWINGANNLGLKTNIAEISDDYNEEGIPDKDSTPGNKVWGEDDIDDAKVLLSISTGLVGHIVMYTAFGLIVLVVFAGGIIGIKKFVL